MHIDAHQHYWVYNSEEYSWIDDSMAAIRRDFLPEHLRPELEGNGFQGSVVVQTRQTLQETRWLLELADRSPDIVGVVGWVDLTDPGVERTFVELMDRPDGRYLVGIRHLVHDEPDADWLLRDDVRRGLAVLDKHGLVYDLLLKVREIPAALRTVGDFPTLRFVIDHIAKPNIGANSMSPWAELMGGFKAHRGHVWCKLSGMAEEADWASWTPQQLAPFVDRVLEIFGPGRCMFGSNWPVCLLAGDYRRIKAALEECTSALSADERAYVMGGSAIEAYRLRISAP